MPTMTTQAELETLLDSFDPDERRAALEALISDHADVLPVPGGNVNMHFHSFFSYNALGWSPSHIAWEARKAGLYAAALCDFDVLDGMDEFLDAGLALGLRAVVNLETRAYLPEYADVDINSPGEQGVVYIMGAGFARALPAGSHECEGLAGYRSRAAGRNVALIERINAKLARVAVDYEADVLPLTPQGVATERHIVTAYIHKSREVMSHPEENVAFWGELFGLGFDEMLETMADQPRMEELVRAKLAKRGGIGYEQPSAATFPAVQEFIDWVASCDAVPMATWLDGTSGGEANGRELLECLVAQGVAAVNIIPDRNWNIADPDTAALKRENLSKIVADAVAMDLPVNIGTEMNKLGLPFVDDLGCEVLGEYADVFRSGACVMAGHSLLMRYANYPYAGDAARSDYPDVKLRNAFFEAVGALPPCDLGRARQLVEMGPEKALDWFGDEIR